MIHDKCPKCGNENLGDHWQNERKLSQYCDECCWLGNPRTPEQQEIPTSKKVTVGHHGGFVFYIYDRYGHVMVISQSYPNTEKAEKALKRELERSTTDIHAGPYTAVLWPDTIEVTGKVYKGASK